MEIHIGDRVADVTLVSKEGNKVQLTIDGKPYEVDIVMAENGSCSILHDGNTPTLFRNLTIPSTSAADSRLRRNSKNRATKKPTTSTKIISPQWNTACPRRAD